MSEAGNNKVEKISPGDHATGDNRQGLYFADHAIK